MQDILEKVIKENLNLDLSEITIEYQKDGLTNHNYIITSKNNVENKIVKNNSIHNNSNRNNKYVVRLCTQNSLPLGINRKAELEAMKAAALLEIGAEIIYYSTESGNMITKYINGEKWSDQDIKKPDNMCRIADTLKKIHSFGYIHYEFSPYKDIESRIHYAKGNNIELPDFLNELLAKLHHIKLERANSNKNLIGLCHNDPFSNNFIDDGTAARLIDWEFAGMGDIFFDLASVCIFYSPVEKEQFLQCYFGQCDVDMLKNLEQMIYVVKFWNTMWAVVQSNLSSDEIDYKSMALHMFMGMKNDL